MADTLLKGTAHFSSLGPQYIISAIVLAALFATAATTRNERVHAVLAVYFLLQTVLISLAFFRTLI